MTSTTHTLQHPHDDRLGQRWAFAVASLALGVMSFVSLLGLEKAVLAILFGALALRPPVARPRDGYARAGIALGGLAIVALIVAVTLFSSELTALVEHLTRLG